MCEHFARRGCIRLFERTSAAAFDGGCTEEDQVQGMTSPATVEDNRLWPNWTNGASPGFFSKWSLRPNCGAASARLTRRRPTRLRPRVRNPSLPLYTTEGVQHPRITPGPILVTLSPHARGTSWFSVFNFDWKMIWTRKKTIPSQDWSFLIHQTTNQNQNFTSQFPSSFNKPNANTRNIFSHGCKANTALDDWTLRPSNRPT